MEGMATRSTDVQVCVLTQVVLADVDLTKASESASVLTSEGHEAAAITCDVRVRAQVQYAYSCHPLLPTLMKLQQALQDICKPCLLTGKQRLVENAWMVA